MIFLISVHRLSNSPAATLPPSVFVYVFLYVLVFVFCICICAQVCTTMIILISVHRLSNSPAATLQLAVTRKWHLLHLAPHIILKHLHLAIIQLSPRLKRIQVKCITHHTLGMTSPHIHVGPGRPSAGQQGRYSFKLRLLTGKLLIPRSSHRACGAQLVGK